MTMVAHKGTPAAVPRVVRFNNNCDPRHLHGSASDRGVRESFGLQRESLRENERCDAVVKSNVHRLSLRNQSSVVSDSLLDISIHDQGLVISRAKEIKDLVPERAVGMSRRNSKSYKPYFLSNSLPVAFGSKIHDEMTSSVSQLEEPRTPRTCMKVWAS